MVPFSLVFLAGGTGSRMESPIPKQYLSVLQKPLARYSFEVFASMPEVQEVVVVCEPQFQEIFLNCPLKIRFAPPGKRRQDSLHHGLQQLQHENPLVCIHDSARPLIDPETVRRTIQAAEEWDAAVVGVKAKATIKICDSSQFVMETLDRDSLWEMQTPQVIRLSLLKEGFQMAHQLGLTVTDDVSLVELLGKKVKVVEGSYTNMKVTYPEDLEIVQKLLETCNAIKSS